MKNNKQFLGFSRYFLFLCSLILLISCNRNEEPITIHFFKYDNPSIPASIDKNEEDSWKPLLNVDLNQSDLVITEENIVGYELETQKLILDSEFKETLEYDKLDSEYRYFVLALGKTPIIGGVTHFWPSAVYFGIPVLYFNDPLLHQNNLRMELYLQPGPGNQELLTDFHNRLSIIGKLTEE